jgi:uncharacterized protein YndB with AHSA1/START domain/ketosteroid isomerase-like protein
MTARAKPIAQPADRVLVISRTFDAPRRLVFTAWTEEPHLMRWLGPPGYETLSCDIDLRPGGRWRIRSRTPAGSEQVEHCIFREIVRPERLVFTQAWEDASGRPGPATLVTVTFAERNGKTQVLFRQAFDTDDARDRNERAWRGAFEHLTSYLPKIQGRRAMAPNVKPTDEAEIRSLLEETTRAFHAKDVERLMARLAPAASVFGLAPPLAVSNPAALRQGLVDWFSSFDGPVGYTFHDMAVTTNGDMAFAVGFARIQGKRTNGEQQTDVWLRATICWRREGGRWMIAHQHMSVPFYMDGSLRAAVDLKP